ncbi:THAP domain-containing protein 5-like isoform X1 [Ptychodera flava]|uniref:THAP domain-containing protein 5-like isoform X1 n=1 Tax=Ptychodera flava TaxID=63121 RepID=UPI00396A508B
MPEFQCAVRDCKAHTRKLLNLGKYPWMSGVTFHPFPHRISQKYLRRKWIDSCRREPSWLPNKFSRVCSRHFDSDNLPSPGDWSHNIVPHKFPYNDWGHSSDPSRPRNQWQLNRGVENHKVLQPAEELHDLVVLETNSSPSLELEVEYHYGTQKRIPPVSMKDGVFTVTSPPSEDHLYCKTDVDEVSSVCVATQTEITGSHLLQINPFTPSSLYTGPTLP